MDVTGVAGTLFAAVTAVSFVASAVAVARAGVSKATIAALTESNRALTERVDLVTKENERQAGRLHEQSERLRVLETENASLRTLKGGEDSLRQVTTLLTAQNLAREMDLRTILTAIQKYGEPAA